MVVKVRPVVEAPEERVQVVGGEPQRVARPDAVRVELVGRVVDAPRSERLFVAQAEAEGVEASELARQEIGSSVQYEDHALRVGSVERRRVVPEPGARPVGPAPFEPVALAPAERVENRGHETAGYEAGDRGGGQAHVRL